MTVVVTPRTKSQVVDAPSPLATKGTRHSRRAGAHIGVSDDEGLEVLPEGLDEEEGSEAEPRMPIGDPTEYEENEPDPHQADSGSDTSTIRRGPHRSTTTVSCKSTTSHHDFI